jgi:hypothetical protein
MDSVLINSTGSSRPSGPDHRPLWRAIRPIAAAFVLMGVADILLAFYPARFGDVAWRFVGFSSVIRGLPLVTLGAVGGLVASLVIERGAKAWGVLNLLLAVGVLACLALFLAAISGTMAAVPQESKLEVTKAIWRTALLGTLYVAIHLRAAGAGLRP